MTLPKTSSRSPNQPANTDHDSDSMRYLYSQVDKSNLDWFDKDTSKATLMRLEIADGELRGLSNLKLHFRYPITAISGRNGTGKSTILACAACAFHNKASGFKTLIRRIPYYTFSDFSFSPPKKSRWHCLTSGIRFSMTSGEKASTCRPALVLVGRPAESSLAGGAITRHVWIEMLFFAESNA